MYQWASNCYQVLRRLVEVRDRLVEPVGSARDRDVNRQASRPLLSWPDHWRYSITGDRPLKKVFTIVAAGIFAIGTSIAFAQAPKSEEKGAAKADVKADAKTDKKQTKAKADTKAEAKSDKAATPATPASESIAAKK